jgi:hypothetical protein
VFVSHSHVSCCCRVNLMEGRLLRRKFSFGYFWYVHNVRDSTVGFTESTEDTGHGHGTRCHSRHGFDTVNFLLQVLTTAVVCQ